MPEENIVIYTDGGSRGNPGPAAIGIVIQGIGGKVLKYSEYIGKSTNNIAEYQAVIFALKKVKQILGKEKAKKAKIEIRLDSELVYMQLSGKYKILEKELQPFFIEAWNLMRDFGTIKFKIISRQENQLADSLLNLELNQKEARLF